MGFKGLGVLGGLFTGCYVHLHPARLRVITIMAGKAKAYVRSKLGPCWAGI